MWRTSTGDTGSAGQPSLLSCGWEGGVRDARVLTVASRNGRGTKPLSSVRQNQAFAVVADEIPCLGCRFPGRETQG